MDRYDCSPGKSQTKRVPHHATPAFNVSSAAEIHRFASSMSTSAWQRSGAHEILAAQFVQRRHECWLLHDPCAVFRDDLVARAVTAEDERLPHLPARPTETRSGVGRLPTRRASR